MNEQIKSLAIQCGVVESHVDWEAAGGNLLEKFANLIIQECIDTLLNDTDRHRKEYFAGLLKEHFGVE